MFSFGSFAIPFIRFFFFFFFLSKILRALFYLTASGVQCCVAAIQNLPELHHSAFLTFLGTIVPILVSLKIRIHHECPCRIG